MEIKIETIDGVQVASIEGDIDASTGAQVSEAILPLAKENAKVILDMKQVPFMASAGLRALLSMHRQVTAKDAKLVLVGLSEDLTDTMSVTGFLKFFKVSETREEAMKLF